MFDTLISDSDTDVLKHFYYIGIVILLNIMALQR